MSDRLSSHDDATSMNVKGTNQIAANAFQREHLDDRLRICPDPVITPRVTAATTLPHVELANEHSNDCPKQRICKGSPSPWPYELEHRDSEIEAWAQELDRRTGHVLSVDSKSTGSWTASHLEFDSHTQQLTLRETIGWHESSSNDRNFADISLSSRSGFSCEEKVLYDKHTGQILASDVDYTDGRREHLTFDKTTGREVMNQVTLANGTKETIDQLRYGNNGRLIGARIAYANGNVAIISAIEDSFGSLRKVLYRSDGSTDVVDYEGFSPYDSRIVSVTKLNRDGSSAFTKFENGHPHSVTLTDTHGDHKYFEADSHTHKMHQVNTAH